MSKLLKLIPLFLLLFDVILGGCVSLYTQVSQATAEATQHNAWKIYRADSGYEIRYPLAAYSIHPVAARPLMRSDEFVYPGVLALEPNDRFFYEHAGQITYKITIGVTGNTQLHHLSCDLITVNLTNQDNWGHF